MKIAVFLVGLLMISSAGWADISNVSVTGTVWRVDGNMVYAPDVDPSSYLALEGSFTANSVNFFAQGPQGSAATLGQFLAFGGANVSLMNAGSLTEGMSNCTSGSS